MASSQDATASLGEKAGNQTEPDGGQNAVKTVNTNSVQLKQTSDALHVNVNRASMIDSINTGLIDKPGTNRSSNRRAFTLTRSGRT
jgi:hypothetical protein